jgi:hypothetical protein
VNLTKRKIIGKWLLWALIISFVLVNIVAVFHAYKFTHFVDHNTAKTKTPNILSAGQKISVLIFGVNNPRPENTTIPLTDYQTINLKSNRVIETWFIKKENGKGTVIIFHGYGGQKASMLEKANIFLDLGYNALLVDFMGSGGSEGNQTTIGFLEAEQVKTCFDYLTQNGEKNIFLFGTSMGSVAIMKAINDFGIKPNGIIIECPFGSMYQTVCARCIVLKKVYTFWLIILILVYIKVNPEYDLHFVIFAGLVKAEAGSAEEQPARNYPSV